MKAPSHPGSSSVGGTRKFSFLDEEKGQGDSKSRKKGSMSMFDLTFGNCLWFCVSSSFYVGMHLRRVCLCKHL